MIPPGVGPHLPGIPPGAGSSPHRAGPGQGYRVGHSVPLLRLTVHLLVEAIESPLYILHGEDTDGRTLGGPPVPIKEMAGFIQEPRRSRRGPLDPKASFWAPIPATPQGPTPS